MKEFKDIFYVMSHGSVQSSEVLDDKQRFGIPIIYIGTEGKETAACPSMLLIPYFVKIHGKSFMNKLLKILLDYGEKYDKKFKPNNTKVEKDIRYLFDVNVEERKISPQNILRAYYGDKTTFLNTSLYSFMPNETFIYSAVLNDNPKTHPYRIGFDKMIPYKNSKFNIEHEDIGNHEQFFRLVSPFGIYKFDKIKKNFEMKHRITQNTYPLKDVLRYIHEESNDPIVYMVHCKSPDKNILMDFEFEEYPLEKVVKGTPTHTKTKTKTKTKKRKLTNNTPINIRKIKDNSPIRKRVKLNTPPKTPPKTPTKTPPKTPTKTPTKTPPNTKTKTNTKKRKTPPKTTPTIRKTTETRPTKRIKLI